MHARRASSTLQHSHLPWGPICQIDPSCSPRGPICSPRGPICSPRGPICSPAGSYLARLDRGVLSGTPFLPSLSIILSIYLSIYLPTYLPTYLSGSPFLSHTSSPAYTRSPAYGSRRHGGDGQDRFPAAAASQLSLSLSRYLSIDR